MGEQMKITEEREQYGISTDTPRDYEPIGLIPVVDRNDWGFENTVKKIRVGLNLSSACGKSASRLRR